MTGKHFILATAGHVDHGKSALVEALTGTDPERLPEEKARGITIDLGFAHLELSTLNLTFGVPPSGGPSAEPPKSGTPNGLTFNSQPSTFSCGIVDVPGHEDFVKNMVAGVGSIDLALLVVAADDGWMPQTEEHLQILTYLGVTRAVVALTKIDLVESNEAGVINSVREKLHATPIAESPVVPTSVVTGRGLDELKETLPRVLAETPTQRDIGKPRLPVDRVFTLRGVGTVVTGTLTGGALSRGQMVVIQPAGKPARIRTIQSHNRDVESSQPGTRTALNLVDVGIEDVRRGDVITLPELGATNDTLDVWLEKSSRLTDGKSLAKRPLKDGALVRVHHGSGQGSARIYFPDQKQLSPGERALAQLRFDSPVFAFLGDRFIVRDWAEQATLAGGVVLDADASRSNGRSERQRKFLARRAESWRDVAASVETQLKRDGVARRSSLLLKSRFSTAEIAGAVEKLAAKCDIIPAGELVADAGWWNAIRQRATTAIDGEHKAHSDHAGLPLSSLRTALGGELPLPEVFDALVADLCRTEFVPVGVAIKRATHRPALPPALQAAGAKLRAVLEDRPLDPPSRKELAQDAPTQQALRFLIQSGEAIEVNAELVMGAKAVAGATEIIRNYLREHHKATVSELRQALGTSRRVVVPLLEKLDRDGLTQRQGDQRVLRPQNISK
ncbi:MAG: SelB C-terminal domain-containing protein [Verrucomicrobia bacterium]|nr:SelB C-terminal domain-containing protein [Verrucomicrobiota bacterium]